MNETDDVLPVRVLDYSGPALDWVTIASFGGAADWLAACQNLLGFGIDCRIGRNDSPLHSELVCDVAGGMSLQVRRAQAARGVSLLRALQGKGDSIAQADLGAELTSGWGGVRPRLVLAVSAVVHVDAQQFVEMASATPPSPVVMASTGWFRKRLRYLASRHRMMFTTDARTPLKFPAEVRLISARKIWIP